MSIGAARTHAREKSETERTEAAVSILTESIAGAEALGRALCALTETEHTSDHRLGKNGRQIADRTDEPKRNIALPVLKGAGGGKRWRYHGE